MKKVLTKEDIKRFKHGGFRSFMNRALELGVSVEILMDAPKVYKFSYDGKDIFTTEWYIPLTKRYGNAAVTNKLATKTVLMENGISVPKGIVASSLSECRRKIKTSSLSFPLICKPLDSSLARGVTWNISSQKELAQAIPLAQKFSKASKDKGKAPFIVEEMVDGKEYRLIVFKNRVLACVNKVPASVIGDGTSSIDELIQAFNKTRDKGFEIRIDKSVRATLKKEHLTFRSVLPKGSTLRLRHNLNMSDGGRAIDCTSEVHPDTKAACIAATEAVGLTFAGIDIISPDISRSEYTILEINSRPYHNMHEKPLVEGTATDISGILLNDLFPGLSL